METIEDNKPHLGEPIFEFMNEVIQPRVNPQESSPNEPIGVMDHS